MLFTVMTLTAVAVARSSVLFPLASLDRSPPLAPLHRQLSLVSLLREASSEPAYGFAYDVNEPSTGDVKSQRESREGGLVTGQYSLVQPDGVRRTVDYRADAVSGFSAEVKNEGEPTTTTETPEEEKSALHQPVAPLVDPLMERTPSPLPTPHVAAAAPLPWPEASLPWPAASMWW